MTFSVLNKKSLSLSLVFLLLFSWIKAQSPDEELFDFQQAYPNENAVIEFTKDYVYFSVVNGELAASLKSEEQIFLLTDRASYYGNDEIWHSELFKLQDLEAYTLIPTTKKYEEKKVTKIEEKDDLGGVNFYDDNKLKLLEFPSLTKGAKKYLSYTYQVVEPSLIGSFRFGQSYESKSSELQISLDKGVELGYKLFNCDSIELTFTEVTNKNGGKTYTWIAHNVEKIESEDDAPNHRYFSPHILYYVKSYEKDGKKENVLDGIEGLHRLYNGFLDAINVEESEELKVLVESLVSHQDSELDKVKKVYQWVQNNIRYVAFEDGYGGFIPRQAKDIYKKRFGDCKDMASIIHEMLKYAGIESHWTWIGSRSIPYKYSEVATPSVDNHMINTYISGNKYYFLDGTSSETPFGIPTSFIQGKEALIHISEDSFFIVKVPEIDAVVNRVEDSLSLSIENKNLIGKGTSQFLGYHRNRIINFLGDYEGEKRKERVKGYLQKGSNKFLLKEYEEKNRYAKDLPFEIDYAFNIPDYLIEVDQKLYLNMNLERYFESYKLEKDRKYDFELDFKQNVNNVLNLEIPENYELEYLPEDQGFEHPMFSYSSVYKVVDNRIVLTQSITLNFLLLNKIDFKDFNSFISSLKGTYSEAIVLKKISHE